eukprot:CAMPEP_0119045546 /NCGR_PEP_ID=MMETSP1177-20130426/40768_1 /TAXON_ID=2985 /ORGANISM="Ochromonas sp, Strain CCMP1899" /LENGTH=283 /DNA_ID=CAMNT_0007017521 /DNA_START=178 /DNA_END=1029 /DNA_ORIENTATION=+
MLVHSSNSRERERVPHDDYFDNSLSGSTISTGCMINIDDPYGDERFDRASDRESGYLTRNVLCVPITGPNGIILGCLEAINKVDGVFNTTDEELFVLLGSQVGIALSNANTFKISQMFQDRYSMCLSLVRAIQGIRDRDSFYRTVVSNTVRTVDADRCVLFCRAGEGMYEIHQEGSSEISLDRGLIASAVNNRSVLNIIDAYENSLFSAAQDKATGYVTKALLIVPLIVDDVVIGVLQMINKSASSDHRHFTTDDVDVLTVYADIFGRILLSSMIRSELNDRN